jgi:hypothetical protein
MVNVSNLTQVRESFGDPAQAAWMIPKHLA